MKKLISIVLLILIFVTNVFAVNPSVSINGSQPINTSSNKIINYIESKRKNLSSNVFCIANDTINYYESFLDEERDYYNLPFSQHLLSNDSLSQQQKQINPINLQMKYEHNPSYYDNPVPLSGLSGRWHDIQVTWDSEKGKWKLTDPTKAILFEAPTDDKRGEWTIYLKGTDTTGKPIFDKESIGFAKFRVHKAPIPKFTFTESGTTATLRDAGSYDVDYQYSKNSRRNAPGDRQYSGIKEFYWSAKIGENWVDLGTGTSVTFNKNGQTVSDYRLTVEDYDGAFASISKSSLILEKPLVDFEFRVGGYTGLATNYAYRGNAGFEKLYVNPLITWNDDAYDPSLYTTIGTRTERWTALKTGDNRTGNTTFTTQVLQNNFTNIINGGSIPVELEAKNKFDYFDTKQKSALVHTLQVQDLTGSQGYVHDPNICTVNPCGFMVGTEATFIFNQNNASVNNDEIKVSITSPLGNFDLTRDGKKFSATAPLADIPSLWDKFDYTLNIHSKRTGELLHRQPGTAYIHTPLNLEGKVNGKRQGIEVNTDEPFTISATTTKYAKEVKVVLKNAATDAVVKTLNLTPNAAHTAWESQVTLDGNTITDEVTLRAEFTATAYNGRDIERDSVDFKVIAYKLLNFRVVKVRDLKLESYYKNYGSGKYDDKKMFVDQMAIDAMSFQPYPISYLTKGYIFEFEIDSINFNGATDTVVIQPSLYSVVGSNRSPQAKEGYWIDSNKKVWEVGTGGHSKYGTIVLTKNNRTITGSNRATWRGQYYIPGTTFLTNPGNSTATAKSNDLKSDIIVHFNIDGLKNGTPKFNYNRRQWGLERTTSKFPYEIGDVIRYKGDASNLDDLQVNRVQ